VVDWKGVCDVGDEKAIGEYSFVGQCLFTKIMTRRSYDLE
jgi:hypothetical protein